MYTETLKAKLEELKALYEVANAHRENYSEDEDGYAPREWFVWNAKAEDLEKAIDCVECMIRHSESLDEALEAYELEEEWN